MKKLLVIFLFLAILVGCSTHKELTMEEKKTRLKQNLAQLNRFQATGILEVNYKELSLKKEFIMKKNPQEIRFDAINSGVMALTVSPFASGYIGEEVYITSYNNETFEDVIMPFDQVQPYLDFESFTPAEINNIIQTKRFVVGEMIMTFNDSYQVATFELDNKEVKFIYNKQNILDTLTIDDDEVDAKLVLDTFKIGDYKINKINRRNHD